MLSNRFGVFSPGPRDCRRLPSCAREHAAASPLSLVTATATPLAREYAAAPSQGRSSRFDQYGNGRTNNYGRKINFSPLSVGELRHHLPVLRDPMRIILRTLFSIRRTLLRLREKFKAESRSRVQLNRTRYLNCPSPAA